MIYLKTFEQVSKQLKDGKIDTITEKWCLGQITASEFINYLESTNEGVISWIKDLKEKIVDAFYTFITKAYLIGISIYEKISIFIKWVINKINNFREKHPTMYKVLLITTIVMIIMIVSASSAHAANNNEPIPVGKIDMAIGWLDSLKTKGEQDPLLVNKAIAHLIDLRDGHITMNNLGQESVNMANAALKTIDQYIKSSDSQQNTSFYQFCVELMEKGRDYIGAVYNKGPGHEHIKLMIK